MNSSTGIATYMARKDKRLRKESVDNIGEARLLRLLELIIALRKNKYSVNEIVEQFDFNQRTTYRYLHLIESVGFTVESEDRKYYISELNRFKGLL